MAVSSVELVNANGVNQGSSSCCGQKSPLIQSEKRGFSKKKRKERNTNLFNFGNFNALLFTFHHNFVHFFTCNNKLRLQIPQFHLHVGDL